jgi:hypothetical protein
VLDPTRAPDREQAPFPVALWCRPAAPECIVESIGLDDDGKWQRLVIGLGLAEMLEQLSPSLLAGTVIADLV